MKKRLERIAGRFEFSRGDKVVNLETLETPEKDIKEYSRGKVVNVKMDRGDELVEVDFNGYRVLVRDPFDKLQKE